MNFPNVMRRAAVLVVSAGLILGCGDDDGGDEEESGDPPTSDQEQAFHDILIERGHDEEFADCATEAAMDELSAQEIETALATDPNEQSPTDDEAAVFGKILAISEECGVNIFENPPSGTGDDGDTDDTDGTDTTETTDGSDTTDTTDAE